jgi:hypothetical protein
MKLRREPVRSIHIQVRERAGKRVQKHGWSTTVYNTTVDEVKKLIVAALQDRAVNGLKTEVARAGRRR